MYKKQNIAHLAYAQSPTDSLITQNKTFDLPGATLKPLPPQISKKVLFLVTAQLFVIPIPQTSESVDIHGCVLEFTMLLATLIAKRNPH